MATVGSLRVNLKANTAHFDKKMARSRKGLKSFGGMAGTATKLLGGLAAALSVRAIIGWTRSTMDMMDATGKMSDRLKIATEDIIGFRHAAKIMGVENAALDKSLGMFVRRLGEVRMGSGEAKDALIALGLNADALVAMDPAKAFRTVADQIRLLPTAADKAAAAYKLFGRQGQQMLNMLELGTAGLDKMQREAESLGLTFSRVDAAKIEEANDAITRMQAAWSGVGRTLALEVAPYVEGIEALLGKIARLQKQNSRAEGRLSDALLAERGSPKALRRAIDIDKRVAAQKIAEARQWLADRLEKMADEPLAWLIPTDPDRINRAKAEADKVVRSWEERYKHLEALRARLDAGDDILPKQSIVAQAVMGGDGLIESASKLYSQASGEIKRAWMSDVREMAQKKFDALADAGRAVFLDTRTPLEQYNARLADLSKLLEAGHINLDTFSRAAKRAKDQLAGGIGGDIASPRAQGRYEVLQSARVSIAGLRDQNLQTPMRQSLEEARRQTKLLERNNQLLQTVSDGGGLQ